MFLAEVAGRLRWTLDALDAAVVGLFVIVGCLKTQDAGLPGGAIILHGATTGVGGGVIRDLLARRPIRLVQRSTPYALASPSCSRCGCSRSPAAGARPRRSSAPGAGVDAGLTSV